MKRRRKLTRRASRKIFRRGARRINKKNLPGFRRGGIAL